MYQPTTLPTTKYAIARRPLLGGEHVLYISSGAAIEVGRFSITAADTGTWTANADAVIPTGGAHLVAMVYNNTGVKGGAEDIVLTIAGKNASDEVISAVATFAVPGYARITERLFPVSMAVDAVVAADVKVAQVTGVTVACAADAVGAILVIYAMPDMSTFSEVAGKSELRIPGKETRPLSIPDKMEGTAWQKPGRSPVAEFSGTLRAINSVDGLGKYKGAEVILRLDSFKEQSAITERTFLLGARYSTEATSPDGDGEVTLNITGQYENALIMAAPTA